MNVDMGASFFILIKKNKGMIPIIDNFTLHFILIEKIIERTIF